MTIPLSEVSKHALDPDYSVPVDVTDSPTFAKLVSHWRGDAETVVNLQGRMYQDVVNVQRINYEHVIHTTEVRRVVLQADTRPRPTFTATETGPMRAVKIDDPPAEVVDEDEQTRFERLETIWSMEAIGAPKMRWRRTRMFFKLVIRAYHVARES